MKTGRRHIQSGKQYDQLFSKPKGENKIIKRFANLDDTLELMKQVTATTLEDTVKIAELLKAHTQEQTCSNIWNFCFNHLQYTKDEMGKEQVRRPSRTWQDRKEGVDCDCMSVFIGTILINLGIPFSFRLTKYQSPEFEHVYPIAHTDNGVIIMDAVVHEYNREVKYSAKKDIKMELQFLNGFEDEEFDQYEELDDIIENEYPLDAQGLVVSDEDLEGLEGRAERKARRAARKVKRKEKIADFKNLSLKEKLKKGLNVINKVNPATALLRAGILASMKLNLMKVPSKLRFAYWTDQEAMRNNMDMGKFQLLKQVREKLEKIFFGAGGKTENLKKAILTGRGNRDRKVILNGLGEIISAVYDEDDLQTILGDELFDDELSEVDFGINGLGSAAATGAAVTAAAGIIGTIAGLIKKIGGLFKKGTPQAEQEAIQENTENEEEKTRKFSLKNLVSNFRNKTGGSTSLPTKSASAVLPEDYSEQEVNFEEFGEDSAAIQRSAEVKTAEDDTPEEKKGIVGWVKENPLLTAGIATAVVGGTILIIRLSKKRKGLSGAPKAKKIKQKTTKNVNGTTKPKRKTNKPYKRRRKPRTQKKPRVQKVELL